MLMASKRMRLVFLGTPAFAVPTLECMVEAGHVVPLVVTQPDRPRGRGQNAAPPPVKIAALRLGLGIVNVHASLLPKYRGAGPIQWAIVNGETRTGVTTMRIDAGLDTGDMLLKAETELGPEENAIDLGRRLAVMGASLLVETIAGLAGGTVVPEKQDPAQATLAPLLKKEDGLIDWSQSAGTIHNRVRGLQPWPGAYTTLRGQTLHIWQSRVVTQPWPPAPGPPPPFPRHL